MKITKASFLRGTVSAADLPAYSGLEIAFLGRSNAGKSTLLNRLTGDPKLARVSKTPGRTLQMNLFSVEGALRGKPVAVRLVDLPGYGFAKVPKPVREQLQEMLRDYISVPRATRVVALIMDSRRDVEAEELEIQSALAEIATPLQVIITKTDKLTRNELARRLQSIAKGFNLDTSAIAVAGEQLPPHELWERLLVHLPPVSR